MITQDSRTCCDLVEEAINALGKRRRNMRECYRLADRLVDIAILVDQHPDVAETRAKKDAELEAKGRINMAPTWASGTLSLLKALLFTPRSKRTIEDHERLLDHLREFGGYADELLERSVIFPAAAN